MWIKHCSGQTVCCQVPRIHRLHQNAWNIVVSMDFQRGVPWFKYRICKLNFMRYFTSRSFLKQKVKWNKCLQVYMHLHTAPRAEAKRNTLTFQEVPSCGSVVTARTCTSLDSQALSLNTVFILYLPTFESPHSFISKDHESHLGDSKN